MSGIEELVKPATESVKLATTALEKVSNVMGFCVKYIDEPLLEIAGKWVDNKKFSRWENQLKIQDRVNEILKARNCKTIRMIPPKIGIPLLDQALLEDDGDLRDIWCKLIANSLDPNFDKEIRHTYIDILKNLTSLDALILKYVYDNTPDRSKLYQITDSNENQINTKKIIENVEAKETEIKLSLYNLKRVQCVWNYSTLKKNKISKNATFIPNSDESYTLTPLGAALIEACMK